MSPRAHPRATSPFGVKFPCCCFVCCWALAPALPEKMHPCANLGVAPALKVPQWEVALSLAQGLRDAFCSCLPKKSVGAGPGWDQSPKSNKASSGEEVILLLGILLCILRGWWAGMPSPGLHSSRCGQHLCTAGHVTKNCFNMGRVVKTSSETAPCKFWGLDLPEETDFCLVFMLYKLNHHSTY